MAGRPIWKGAISFGLVHVPITLYSLEQRFDLHFKLLDSRTKATVRYERVNETTGEEVPWDKIVKGYELEKDNFVILSDEDFKKAAIEAAQTIEIQDFVNKADIGDVYFDKPYVLVPQKKAEKGYVLLRQVLAESNRAGIAKVVIRTRQYLAAILPMGDGLVLMLLRFAQEIRKLEEFALPNGSLADYKISDRELALAKELVDAQTGEWNPSQYHDEYREQLLAWIEAKAEKGEVSAIAHQEEDAEPAATNVVDLAELLRKSIGKGKDSKPTEKPKKPAPKRKGAKSA